MLRWWWWLRSSQSSISSKQLVYQSDPDPTQLMNLNKTIWTQLRYSLLWSWKMRKVALRSFSSWIIQGCYMCFVRVKAISFAADAHLTEMTMGLTSLWYPIFNEWSPLRPDQWWPWVALTNNSIGRAMLLCTCMSPIVTLTNKQTSRQANKQSTTQIQGNTK